MSFFSKNNHKAYQKGNSPLKFSGTISVRDEVINFQGTRYTPPFNCQSSLDWMVIRHKLREKFIENKCYSIVGPLPQPIQEVIRAAGIEYKNAMATYYVQMDVYRNDVRRYNNEMQAHLAAMNQHTQAMAAYNEPRQSCS